MAAYNNTFHYVWYGSFDDTSFWETYYIRSTNSGNSWSDNVMLTTDDDHNSYWSCISTNEYGDAVLCWTDFKYSPSPFSGDVLVRYSYDNGNNWTDEEQITFDHLVEHSHIFWRADTIHAVWERAGNYYRDVFYLRSTDGGVNWGDQQRLDHDPADSYWPRVASSNGRVYVIWADNRYDPDNDIYKGVYFTRYEEDVGIDEEISLPTELEVLSAYPNPFNSTTIISCSNLRGGDIDIYDITGKLVRQIHSGGRSEGKVTWDATDAFGETVSSGIYFVRANLNNNTETI